MHSGQADNLAGVVAEDKRTSHHSISPWLLEIEKSRSAKTAARAASGGGGETAMLGAAVTAHLMGRVEDIGV
jgi:hypothetical protein